MLAYCDYIAETIRSALREDAWHVEGTYIDRVEPVKMDLHPEKGYFQSTKKTMEVYDINNKKYRVIVEEL